MHKITSHADKHPVGMQTITFDGLGIAPKFLELLDRIKFITPTPIQHKAIPHALEGKDLIGIAQTGTGKTLAFALPILQRFFQIKGRALVIVPTRELAVQVSETFQKFSSLTGIRPAVVIGGASMNPQIQELRRNPRVIIATPGRLIDHMEHRTVRLMDISILVLDEADRMLDMGFAPQIDKILRAVPSERQTMLFSATMPLPIVKMATSHMKLPVSIEIAPSGTAAELVTHELFIVRQESKRTLLVKLLEQYHGSVLVFCRTRIGARKVSSSVRERGYRAAAIHSDLSLGQRREALEGFKSGKYRILVATDIASRGIDVKGIELVINYDLPEDAENYIHRIGRTGRAGHQGHAISLATPDQRSDVQQIESLMKSALPVSRHPEIPAEEFAKPMKVFSSHRGRGRRSRFGRRRR